MNARILNEKWGVDAGHALYREDGTWYHQLREFPGALFDKKGYIVFKSRAELEACDYLHIKKQITVQKGISAIPGYVQVVIDEAEQTLTENGVVAEVGGRYEGRKGKIQSTVYERDPVARALCLKCYGTGCCVCGFDFGEVYGDVARGFIHVHHLIPLSEVREEYKVDPINDLRPVCPNCHAIIHKRKPPYTIEEMKEKL